VTFEAWTLTIKNKDNNNQEKNLESPVSVLEEGYEIATGARWGMQVAQDGPVTQVLKVQGLQATCTHASGCAWDTQHAMRAQHMHAITS
jgi:hypothetical protein